MSFKTKISFIATDSVAVQVIKDLGEPIGAYIEVWKTDRHIYDMALESESMAEMKEKLVTLSNKITNEAEAICRDLASTKSLRMELARDEFAESFRVLVDINSNIKSIIKNTQWEDVKKEEPVKQEKKTPKRSTVRVYKIVI